MFDGLKSMAGLAGIMKDLPRIKARMEQVKEELAALIVEADTGGGAVKVVASAQMQIVSVTIDPALLSGMIDSANPDHRALAEDLIGGAVNAALVKAREAAQDHLAAAARELNLPLPPGGLGGLLG